MHWRRGWKSFYAPEIRSHHSIEIRQGGELRFQSVFFVSFELESLSSTKERSVLKHGDCFRVEGPVSSLARAVGTAGDFDETIIETQIVS